MSARAFLAVGVVFTVASVLRADTVSPPSPSPAAGPSLDRALLPARGRQTATLQVPAFGRYAIRVESKQGTALQLVDRMAGPGNVAGQPGETDGRLDLFLDRGEYQLVTVGHRRASGEAKLDVRAFTERHAPRAPLLVELKPVDEELGDYEQSSYWLDLRESRAVWLEAAGRSLADLRLWRDGTWLVDAEPEREVVQPVVGQPLSVCRLAVTLDPGLYLLTAYGGVSRPWAVDDAHQPFHLRYGIPRLGAAGRQRMSVSAFGRDRFLVPARTSFFRLELPEARPATLEVGDDLERPFARGPHSAAIAKTSRPPVGELLVSGVSRTDRVVTVSGEAGQPYVLQHFELRDEYPFAGSGEHWVGTVHAGSAGDSIDATGILVRSRRYDESGGWEPFAEQTIPLGLASGWARRANLLDTATLFVHVRQAGSYEVVVEDIRAEVLVEPFLLWRPDGYSAPPWQTSPSRWDLEAGYYVVTLRPTQKGIARIVMRPKGLLDRALDLVGLGGSEPPSQPPRPAVRFPRLSLETSRSYTLYLNRQPEVHSGAVVRTLPLDLSDPLPVAQSPGENVSVPFRSEEAGTLRAEAEDGQPLELSLDGGSWDKGPSVAPGSHEVAVRPPAKDTVVYALRFEPQRLTGATPLPLLPDARLATLPRFEVLTAAQAQRFDLGPGGSRTFLVRTDRAGLYRVQSTGLLATGGTLRSRTITSLSREAQNGVGRNFALGQYLREGDYQVTARVQGQSHGHLGLELVAARVAEGGDLRNRVPARATLAAGDALVYRFTITTPGRFRVRSLGLERGFRCRLEDEHGWPLVAPGGEADLTLDYEPGRYRFTVLPEATAARVVTMIEPVATPLQRRGHGPHRLPLARRLEHLWREPERGERVPDRWDLKLPGPARLRIELTGGMQGRLLSLDAPETKPIEVPVAQGFFGLVSAGSYRLEVVSARPDDRASYELAVWPEPLLAGLDRVVNAPADVPVSIGEAGLYEITSFGGSDVRGRLFDAEGREVARSDDRPDDWNLQITDTLAPGQYRLRVEAVGAASASTTLAVRRREETAEKPLVIPGETDLSPGPSAHLYPLTLAADAELLSVVARARESIGVALEVRDGESWRSVATASGHTADAACALARGRDYRLRVWSLDRRDAPVHLTVSSPTARRVGEAPARAGLRLEPEGVQARLVAVAIAIERPGAFRVDGAGLVWCAAPLVACSEAANGIVSSPGPTLWALGKPGIALKADRIALDGSGPVPLVLPRSGAAAIDVAPGTGPVLIRAVSQGGQPGVAVDRAEKVGRSGVFAVGTRAAVAAWVAGGTVGARAWDARPGSAGTPITADLEVARFPAARVEDASERLGGELAAGAVRMLKLPRGAKRVRLALSASAVAAFSSDGRVESVHWAETGPLAETIETDSDRLTLFPPREGSGSYALEIFRLEAEDCTPPLAAGGSFEAQPGRSGWQRLAVAPALGSSRIQVRGATSDAVLVGADGSVHRGSDLEVPSTGGTLLLPHGTDLIVAQRDPLAAEVAAGQRPITVEPPASLALHGREQRLHVEPHAPVLLRLRAPGPALTTLKREGEPASFEIHREGVRLDVYSSGRPLDVTIRAVAGGMLRGPAELTATPVLPIGEGLGPESLLGPGQSRLFSFVVTQAGPVGIAVRADADLVETTLLSSEGRLLGRGPMQMPTLDPGTYLLQLSAPSDAAPIRARPSLVGVTPPDTGPPEDVVKGYAAATEQEIGASFTARHVEPEPESAAEGGEGEGEREWSGEGTSGDESPAPDEAEPSTSEDAGASEGGLP